MEIYKKLQKIQLEMKAPKNLYNSYGKFNYRNAVSILEAFKPFGDKYGLALTVNDEVVLVGERIYIKATATLYDIETSDYVFNSAFARESAEKKGMDDSQITGTASSYARKYALNGLFLLDDTKDADTDEYHKQTSAEKSEAKKPVKKTSEPTIQELIGQIQLEAIRKDVSIADIEGRYGKKLTEFDENTAWRALKAIRGKVDGN